MSQLTWVTPPAHIIQTLPGVTFSHLPRNLQPRMSGIRTTFSFGEKVSKYFLNTNQEIFAFWGLTWSPYLLTDSCLLETQQLPTSTGKASGHSCRSDALVPLMSL